MHADILRGSLDPSEYRQPVMTLLFLKRLNDTFEEKAEKLIKQGKISGISAVEAVDNPNDFGKSRIATIGNEGLRVQLQG